MSDGVCNRCRKPLAFTSSSQELCPSCAEVARLEAALREAERHCDNWRAEADARAAKLISSEGLLARSEAALATLRGEVGRVLNGLDAAMSWTDVEDWVARLRAAVGGEVAPQPHELLWNRVRDWVAATYYSPLDVPVGIREGAKLLFHEMDKAQNEAARLRRAAAGEP